MKFTFHNFFSYSEFYRNAPPIVLMALWLVVFPLRLAVSVVLNLLTPPSLEFKMRKVLEIFSFR